MTANPSTQHLPDQLEIWQQTLNWQPTAAQQDCYRQLYQEVLQGNQQLNLTRIVEPQEFWEKHLWDSLRGIKPWLDPAQPQHSLSASQSLQVIDIGTGAGFPGVPIAIACPNWHVTLLDSTQKKIAFLQTLLATLALTTVQATVGRAEQVGQMAQHREQYDLALVRAVAAASVCAEYALPLLKQGGLAILYRGQWDDAETAALESAAKKLGGAVKQIESFVTPISHSARHCVYLEKIAPTRPAFPRPVGVPTQKPL